MDLDFNALDSQVAHSACAAGDSSLVDRARDAQPWVKPGGLESDAQRRLIARIIHTYDARIVRWYCRIRFLIMRLRMLEEIDQYIPSSGRILDLGCGFGLFSLFFASRAPGRMLYGCDLNPRRIEMARVCAAKLGIPNVDYKVSDATCFIPENPLSCIYMLDLLHHLPADLVPALLRRIYLALTAGGTLIIKDVDTTPAYKRLFTLALDRLMVGMEPIRYWSRQEMLRMLADAGFVAYTHDMRDWLPYPHRLYVCRKGLSFAAATADPKST